MGRNGVFGKYRAMWYLRPAEEVGPHQQARCGAAAAAGRGRAGQGKVRYVELSHNQSRKSDRQNGISTIRMIRYVFFQPTDRPTDQLTERSDPSVVDGLIGLYSPVVKKWSIPNTQSIVVISVISNPRCVGIV